MTPDQLKELIEANDIDKLKTVMEVNHDVNAIENALKQYDPKQHDIHNTTLRPNKVIQSEDVINSDGSRQRGEISFVDVHRLSIPIEKKIVLLAAAFLGNPELQATEGEETENNLLQVIRKIWRDNKLDYRFKKAAKITMSEMQCAELWYSQEAEADYWKGEPFTGKRKFRMKLLAHSLGDTLYPVYDNYGDMIAFGRGYYTKNEEGQEVEHLDIYTAERIYFNKKSGSEWTVNRFEDNPALNIQGDGGLGVPNIVGKIPVIYYSQPLTEWHDVSEMIARLETKISNHADTNDYYDSPILFAEGEIEGFGDKGERGKVLEGKAGAKVSYLTWDNAPESTKMEVENLLKFIHSYTHTPDISFEQMKGLGVFSGIALKMLFLDAHLKASDKEEMFGECVQRRINYLKKAVATLDTRYEAVLNYEISPKFEYFMPKDVIETINTLVTAKGAGLMSKQSAIQQNPLVENAEAEIDLIKQETNEAAAKAIVSNPNPVI